MNNIDVTEISISGIKFNVRAKVNDTIQNYTFSGKAMSNPTLNKLFDDMKVAIEEEIKQKDKQ